MSWFVRKQWSYFTMLGYTKFVNLFFYFFCPFVFQNTFLPYISVLLCQRDGLHPKRRRGVAVFHQSRVTVAAPRRTSVHLTGGPADVRKEKICGSHCCDTFADIFFYLPPPNCPWEINKVLFLYHYYYLNLTDERNYASVCLWSLKERGEKGMENCGKRRRINMRCEGGLRVCVEKCNDTGLLAIPFPIFPFCINIHVIYRPRLPTNYFDARAS